MIQRTIEAIRVSPDWAVWEGQKTADGVVLRNPVHEDLIRDSGNELLDSLLAGKLQRRSPILTGELLDCGNLGDIYAVPNTDVVIKSHQELYRRRNAEGSSLKDTALNDILSNHLSDHPQLTTPAYVGYVYLSKPFERWLTIMSRVEHQRHTEQRKKAMKQQMPDVLRKLLGEAGVQRGWYYELDLGDPRHCLDTGTKLSLIDVMSRDAYPYPITSGVIAEIG